MPLFLETEQYVPTSLEETYQSTWDSCPEPLKEAVEGRISDGSAGNGSES
jgi:hypothetical protein